MKILSWLFPKRDASGFTPGERAIFPYWDGKRHRLGDPLALHRALLTDPDFDMEFDPKVAEVPTKDGLNATGRVAAAVRKAFGVKTLDDGGLTDTECLTLFCEFGGYLGQLTEDTRPLASSPGSTESPAESGIGTGAGSG